MNLERNVKNVPSMPMGQFVLVMESVSEQVTRKVLEIVNVMTILLVGNATNAMKTILCPRANVINAINHARLVTLLSGISKAYEYSTPIC